jgi:hypothetical protein
MAFPPWYFLNDQVTNSNWPIIGQVTITSLAGLAVSGHRKWDKEAA